MLTRVPIPVAARSKEWGCGRSLVGIAGSNLAGYECCVLSGRRSLRKADHSYKVVLPSVVCLSVILEPQQ